MSRRESKVVGESLTKLIGCFSRFWIVAAAGFGHSQLGRGLCWDMAKPFEKYLTHSHQERASFSHRTSKLTFHPLSSSLLFHY